MYRMLLLASSKRTYKPNKIIIQILEEFSFSVHNTVTRGRHRIALVTSGQIFGVRYQITSRKEISGY